MVYCEREYENSEARHWKEYWLAEQARLKCDIRTLERHLTYSELHDTSCGEAIRVIACPVKWDVYTGEYTIGTITYNEQESDSLPYSVCYEADGRSQTQKWQNFANTMEFCELNFNEAGEYSPAS